MDENTKDLEQVQQAAEPPVYQNMEPGVQPPKKKGTLAAVIAVCVLIFILAIAAVVVVAGMFSSPKSKVMKAISTTMADSDKTLSEYLGSKEMALRTAGGQYSSELELILEGFEDAYGSDYSMLSGAGLRAQNSMDYSAKKATGDLQIVYNGANLIELTLFADDAEAGIAMPDYYDGSLAVNTETLAADYNDSYFRQALYAEPIEEGLGGNLFDVTEIDDEQSLFQEQYAEDLKNAYDAMEVVKTDGKMTFSAGDRSVTCKGYEVTIPQVAVQVIADDLFDYLENNAAEAGTDYSQLRDMLINILDKDLVYTVYLDKKGRMVSINYGYDITYEGETLSCQADFLWMGEKHMWDNFSASVQVTNEELDETVEIKADYEVTKEGGETRQKLNVTAAPDREEDSMSFAYKASLDTESGAARMEASLAMSDEELLAMALKGEFQDVKAGSQYRFDMDSLEFSVEDSEYVLTLSGSYAIGELKQEIDCDYGTRRYLLKMDEDEFDELGDEISDNIMKSPLISFLMNL